MKEDMNDNAPNDMTKCVAYTTCKKTPDWSNETTLPATEPPATDPPATDPPATDPPATDPPAVADCCDTLNQVTLHTGNGNGANSMTTWTKVGLLYLLYLRSWYPGPYLVQSAKA